MTDLTLFAVPDGLNSEHFGIDEHGRAYAQAGPFAKAMGYRDAGNATRLLDSDEVGTRLASMNLADGRVQGLVASRLRKFDDPVTHRSHTTSQLRVTVKAVDRLRGIIGGEA